MILTDLDARTARGQHWPRLLMAVTEALRRALSGVHARWPGGANTVVNQANLYRRRGRLIACNGVAD